MSFLGLAPFAAPRDARCGTAATRNLIEWPAMVVGAKLVDRPTALFAKMVRQLVCRDREQVCLHVAFFVIMRQAGQETNERFLYHVFAGRPVAKPAIHE